jgi:hypothetical protein
MESPVKKSYLWYDDLQAFKQGFIQSQPFIIDNKKNLRHKFVMLQTIRIALGVKHEFIQRYYNRYRLKRYYVICQLCRSFGGYRYKNLANGGPRSSTGVYRCKATG